MTRIIVIGDSTSDNGKKGWPEILKQLAIGNGKSDIEVWNLSRPKLTAI